MSLKDAGVDATSALCSSDETYFGSEPITVTDGMAVCIALWCWGSC